MSEFSFLLSAEPYYYNCHDCGGPILEKDIATTENARRTGVCLACARKRRTRETRRRLRVNRPPQTARLN